MLDELGSAGLIVQVMYGVWMHNRQPFSHHRLMFAFVGVTECKQLCQDVLLYKTWSHDSRM